MIVALAILASTYLALLLIRSGCALSYARSLKTSPVAPLAPRSLTLVQPILSGDPLLESRLAANLSAVPDQCFLWLVDEDDAEARRITGLLRAAHPGVHLEVMICPPCPDATNPKLWKLRDATGRVGTPFFGVLDDDTVLTSSSAAILASSSATHTVATGLPCYEISGGLPSSLLAQFVNNNSAFTYLGTARLLAPFTVNGMAYVLRREKLPELGNFSPILRELTDDLALATLVLKGGGKICQTTATVRVQSGVESFAHYLRFMHRWYVFTLLLMRRQKLSVQVLIFLLHGLPPMLLVTILVLAFREMNATTAALVAGLLVTRSLVVNLILRRFFGPGLHQPIASMLSELMQPVHLIHAMAYRTIRWRTRRYRVRDTDDFSAA